MVFDNRLRYVEVHGIVSLVQLANSPSAVIISFSDLTSKEMACDNIQLDRMAPGSTPGIYTVRVVDNASMCRYHIVIDRDCNYVVRLALFSRTWRNNWLFARTF